SAFTALQKRHSESQTFQIALRKIREPYSCRNKTMKRIKFNVACVLITLLAGSTHYAHAQVVIAQQAYIKASNTHSTNAFGWAVAISGDTMVVGAHDEGSSATGVDGNQNDNSVFRAGAAYVFVRTGTNWRQ